MGTAGLDVRRLSGLLEHRKVTCTLIEGDHALDRCVLRLSSDKRPGVVAFLEYVNQGSETRSVRILVQPAGVELQVFRGNHFDPQNTLYLRGPRRDDPQRILRWVEKEFLISKAARAGA
jgi:hypothetical protein